MEEVALSCWNQNVIRYNTQNCAILWTNGSGKTTLTRYWTGNEYIFISAQRNLVFQQRESMGVSKQKLEKKSFSFSGKEKDLLYPINGNFDNGISEFFSTDYINNTIQNDFETNLEIIIREYLSKHAEASINHHDDWVFNRPETKLDKLISIWKQIFKKKIRFSTDEEKLIIQFWETDYGIETLSDWERSALYLILKCILAPKNSIIIVDEWETHLNPALLYELWDGIERARTDCRFVYISHDIDFITSRNNCTKFWIKSFSYPDQREIEKIDNDNVPEELILKIIGSKKEKILFVEWHNGSEHNLYQKIYPDFKVISLGSCQQIISYTKVLNNSPESYNKQYFWLIDRDFRTEEEIARYQAEKIYTLPVAEFENIFFREEVVRMCLWFLGESDIDTKRNNLKEQVMGLKNSGNFKKAFYKYHIQQQIEASLSGFTTPESFSFSPDLNTINSAWQGVQWITDFNGLLSKLNDKWIKGISPWKSFSDYQQQVINFFNTINWDSLRSEFLKFMPNIQ